MKYFLMVLAACGNPAPTDSGGDTDTDTDIDTDTCSTPPCGDPETLDLPGRCPANDRIGGIRIDNGDVFGFVDGTFRNGVVPNTIPTPVAHGSGCSLDRRENPTCDPTCLPGFTCDLPDENGHSECIEFPASQDLGTIKLYGTLPSSIEIEPIPITNTYSNTTVDNPPVAKDSPVELRITDGPWGAFTMDALGVEPLVPQSEPFIADSHADQTVTWTPSGGLGRSRIYFSLNIDQHGNSPVLLSCDWPDTGEGTVPADLIEGIIAAGVTGFPSATLMRYTADQEIVSDGCVDLEVTSKRGMSVDVPGVIPCAGPQDCPHPLHCAPPPVGICQ